MVDIAHIYDGSLLILLDGRAVASDNFDRKVGIVIIVTNDLQVKEYKFIGDSKSKYYPIALKVLKSEVFYVVFRIKRPDSSSIWEVKKFNSALEENTSGWPQRFSNRKPGSSLRISSISLNVQDIYIAGTIGLDEPFVVSFDHFGNQSDLHSIYFNEPNERWLSAVVAADQRHFYLAGYCKISNSKSTVNHYIKIRKFDRYGLPV